MMRQLLVCLLTLAAVLPALGDDDLQALVRAGELSVNSSMDSGLLVPGQRAELVVEVATQNWFTGGTRIRIPEIPGLVILQTQQFAANASETRGGQTWVIQRWALDVYPQRAGEFTIPAIAMTVQVNGGDAGNLSGELEAPAVSFTVSLPAELEQAPFWVAAPEFSVSQSVDRSIDALQAGDAFTRRIEFTARDVQAMMLPAFTEEPVSGLAAYPAPPQLENSTNRGQITASRLQTISYVAEEPGSYLLPQQDFFWWNTTTGELELLSLPALEVEVTGAAGAATADTPALLHRQTLIVLGTSAALVTLLGWLLLRFRPWRLLQRYRAPALRLWRQVQALRRPALPKRLNPDNSAAE